MSLRVVGAGLPRTGTRSLKLALERLLGERCYHMSEVFQRPADVPVWRGALRGNEPDWSTFLGEYGAAVDWPASAFWRELVAAYPDAPVVLSVREEPLSWWRSADATILGIARRNDYAKFGEWLTLFHELLRERIDEHWDDEMVAIAAYQRHNDEVRRTVSPDRLVEWRPSEGWGPICQALDLAVPSEPFPYVNTTEEWERRSEEPTREESAVR